MLFLTSFAGLLSLGAAAPSISTFPCGFESSTQVGHASFLEWIVQIPEQVLPQFKWCNKRSESGVPPIYDLPRLPKRSKTSTESGDSIDEPNSRFTDPAPIPKRSEGSTEAGESVESVEKSDSHLIDPGHLPERSEVATEDGIPPIYGLSRLPKRSKTSTELGDSIDEPDSRFTDPAPIPKRSETSIESGESVDDPEPPITNLGIIPKRSEASTESGESVDEPGKLP